LTSEATSEKKIKMKIEGIIALAFGIFCIVLIASTGAFSEIINGFSEAMGVYGFIIGVCIVGIIILGFLGLRGKNRW